MSENMLVEQFNPTYLIANEIIDSFVIRNQNVINIFPYHFNFCCYQLRDWKYWTEPKNLNFADFYGMTGSL